MRIRCMASLPTFTPAFAMDCAEQEIFRQKNITEPNGMTIRQKQIRKNRALWQKPLNLKIEY
jgi:hypothetical protein